MASEVLYQQGCFWIYLWPHLLFNSLHDSTPITLVSMLWRPYPWFVSAIKLSPWLIHLPETFFPRKSTYLTSSSSNLYSSVISSIKKWQSEHNSLPCFTFPSVQFSRSVVSDSLWPHELQHARPPCRSPTPRVHSNSCPSSRWCHPAISSSVVPFSSCPQSLPASDSLPMSQLFPWGGQSTGASALASFFPKNTQGWSPSEWTGWISLQSKGLSRVFSKTTVQKHQFFSAQLSSQSNSHIPTWPLEKP